MFIRLLLWPALLAVVFIALSVRPADAATQVVASVPLPGVAGVAVNPVTGRVYVADSGSGQVQVVDGGTDTALAPVITGGSPDFVAVNPAANLVYALDDGGPLYVIDGATGLVAGTVAVSGYDVDVNPVTGLVYVTNPGGFLKVIAGMAVVATVPVGSFPVGVEVNPATNRIYVANGFSDSVTVINAITNTVLTTFPLPIGSTPTDVAVNPVTGRLYVATWNSAVPPGIVYALDQFTGAQTAALPMTGLPSGPNANGMLVDSTANRLYVVDGASLRMFDGPLSVMSSVTLGGVTDGLAFNAVNGRIYAGNTTGASKQLLVLADPSTATPVPTPVTPTPTVPTTSLPTLPPTSTPTPTVLPVTATPVPSGTATPTPLIISSMIPTPLPSAVGGIVQLIADRGAAQAAPQSDGENGWATAAAIAAVGLVAALSSVVAARKRRRSPL